MKDRSQEQKEQDHTLLAAGALIVAGALIIGMPPWILFGI